MDDDGFTAAISAYHAAIGAMGRGDCAPTLALWSRGPGVVLANPLGPPIVGHDAIAAEAAKVAGRFASDAESRLSFDESAQHVGADMGYFIGIERAVVRRADNGEWAEMALRVTTVLRREAEGWRIALRHADRITAPQRQ